MLGMYVKEFLENLQNKKKKKKKASRKSNFNFKSELSPADLLSHSKSKLSGLVSILGGPEGILPLLQDPCLFLQLLE